MGTPSPKVPVPITTSARASSRRSGSFFAQPIMTENGTEPVA
jgi:hypothetical protein